MGDSDIPILGKGSSGEVNYEEQSAARRLMNMNVGEA